MERRINAPPLFPLYKKKFGMEIKQRQREDSIDAQFVSIVYYYQLVTSTDRTTTTTTTTTRKRRERR
jgi:hypothetical protein